MALSDRSKTYRILFRLLVAGASAALIFLVFQVSVASVAGRSNPALALDWDPDNARALARLADETLEADTTADVRTRVKGWAEAALRRDPTITSAARILGLVADIEGDRERAVRLFRYAHDLSRRDLATQLWLIDEAVARDDVEQALRHYDIALRTSRLSPPILFPILVAATEDRPLIRPLAAVLARKPDWATPFLSMLVEAGPSIPNLVLLLETIEAMEAPANSDIVEQFTRRLAREGDYRTAWAVYSDANPAVSRAGVRNGDFERIGANVPFEWSFASERSLSAEPLLLEGERNGSALFLHAATGRGGEVARQLLMLAPGRYRLSALVGELDPADSPSPRLSVSCVETERELATVELDASEGAAATRAGIFTVPAGCSAQNLILVMPATQDPGGVSGWINSIEIRPSATGA